MTHTPDPWSEGYRAARDDGATYDDNPYQEPEATPWAFGCSEGMKERNKRAFQAIAEKLGQEAAA